MRYLLGLFLASGITLPALAGAEPDIRRLGAVGDGKTDCTAAIQQAIDQCAAEGGGTVRLPAGRWLVGTLYLVSNLTLVLEKDCTLLGSRNGDDYGRPRPGSEFRWSAILAGSGLKNVTLRGEGTIDGQGEAFRDKTKRRPKNIYLEGCRNVTVEGLRLRNSGSWMQHYRLCDGLAIRNIDVFNHVTFNNDGLDVDSCRNVVIENCRVDSDDDAIVLKSLSREPCRDVVIRDCKVSSHCNAIKLGTESGGGFRDIAISRCKIHSPRESKVIYGRQRGLAGIALEIVDGGTLENVLVDDVQIDGVTAPLFLRLGNRARRYGSEAAPPVGTFRNVSMSNITAVNASDVGCAIAGLPGHPIRDVRLRNVTLTFDGGGTHEMAAREIRERPEAYPESTMFGTLPAYGLYCRHVENLHLVKVTLRTRTPDMRPAVVLDDVKDFQAVDLQADRAPGAAETVRK